MDGRTKVAAYLVMLAESFVALSIWSVWSWRMRRKTNFRGKDAENLMKEFQAYGYPIWLFRLVGAIKCSFASILVFAIMYPYPIVTFADVNLSLAFFGSAGLLILMIVAILSHVKVLDPPERSSLASAIAFLSVLILLSEGLPDSNEMRVSAVSAPVRLCLGLIVAMACFGMWFRSYRNGDYDLETYHTLDNPLLNA